jgi:hypothetical protein
MFLAEADLDARRRFLAASEARRAYDRRDPEPCDISFVPRVVTAEQAAEFASICGRIVAASLERVLDIHAGREPSTGVPLAWIAGLVPRLPPELFGNVRLDFLLERGRPRLLEGGWVNLSAVDYAPQAALALLDCEPALAGAFGVARPAERMRQRLVEQGVRRLAILVKEAHTVYAANDFDLIRELLGPIESVIVAEPDFGTLRGGEGCIHVGDFACEGVYLRALDGPDAFAGRHAAGNRRTLELLLASGVAFHDHPLMLLAEDKNLAWLVDRDPTLTDVVPRTSLPGDTPRADVARWVLKLRDRHSGEGVFLEPDEMLEHWDDPRAILQERIEPDRFPVRTVHGHAGEAVTDLAVHVSYRYDVGRRGLVTAEIAGFFSRFSLTGGKVNLCTGGGIVPVLSERNASTAAAQSQEPRHSAAGSRPTSRQPSSIQGSSGHRVRDREAFREALVTRMFCEPHDLRDVALEPLVVTLDEHARYEAAARRITAAALAAYADRRDPARFSGDSFQRLVQSLPLQQKTVFGNARLDFLPTAAGPRLLELNFVGVGTTARPHQTARALLDCLPSLQANHRVLLPTDAFARQLGRLGCRTLALLTKDNDREYGTPWLDRLLIQRQLSPVEVLIVPRREWDGFTSDTTGLSFRGKPVDAIYPRELTWRTSIEEGIEQCRFFLAQTTASKTVCFDPWGLILVEDKDLSFLLEQDATLTDIVPRTWSLGHEPADIPPAELVLKRRHDHGGEGVIVGPESLPQTDREDWLVQERLRGPRIPITSLLGLSGTVTHDIATHVSYHYDLERRELVHCELSGYLARFAPVGDVVNLSQGGGVIPVLVENPVGFVHEEKR